MPNNVTRTYLLQNKFGLSVSVDPELGHYNVSYQGQSWLGRGIVSVLRNNRWYRSQSALGTAGREDHRTVVQKDSELRVDGIRTGSDSDVPGAYDFIELSWELTPTGDEFVTGFRLYRDQPYLVFVQRFPEGFKEYANGNWAVPSVVFPQFCGGRSDLYSWASVGMFAHRFGYGQATSIGGNVDLLLLTDNRNDAAILSPFSNYLAATQQSAPFGGRHHQFNQGLHCGIQGLAAEIPAGYEHSHVLVAGQGPNCTFATWGGALLQKSGKAPPSKYADDTIKYPTYWDDYGAYYCQHRFVEEGYNSYEEILLALEQEARENGLNIGAYQVLDLDQLRYLEGLFEPRDDLFPHGMAWLREKLGKPIHAYVAWLPGPSPYRQYYPFFEGQSWGWVPLNSMGEVFYSEDYWRYTAEKLVAWGCICLQHDFLSVYEGEPGMMSGIDNMDRFFKNMAKALHEQGLSMQYCMALPRNVMESAENPTIISLQGTWDHHAHSTALNPCSDEADNYCWKHLLFTNAFYGAVGLWPCRDNIQTVADPNAYEDVLLANLTGGSVQLGHRIGECDFDLLRKTFREGDGLLLKPDGPITPLDRCYREGGAVGYAHTTLSGRTWYYVLSLPSAGYLAGFSPADLRARGSFAVYDYKACSVAIKESTTPIDLAREAKHEYFVLAPVLENGMAVIGDVSKFVTMADMRIASVDADEDGVRVGVTSSEAKSPIIAGYSEERPTEVEIEGAAAAWVSSLSRLRASESGWFWDYISKLWYVKVGFAGAREMETRRFTIG